MLLLALSFKFAFSEFAVHQKAMKLHEIKVARYNYFTILDCKQALINFPKLLVHQACDSNWVSKFPHVRRDHAGMSPGFIGM